MKESTYKKYCLVIDEWFVNGFNGTKAYQKYYTKSKDDSAAVKFNELVRIGKVAEYIDLKYKQSQEISGYTHKKLLEKLVMWVESDITETMCLSLEEIKKLPLEIRQLISEYTADVETKGEDKLKEKIKIKFVSKEVAAEKIAKHIGFYKDHNHQKAEGKTLIIKKYSDR